MGFARIFAKAVSNPGPQYYIFDDINLNLNDMPFKFDMPFGKRHTKRHIIYVIKNCTRQSGKRNIIYVIKTVIGGTDSVNDCSSQVTAMLH